MKNAPPDTETLLTIYAQRRDALREVLAECHLDALLVSLDANRYYLSGFERNDAQPDESSGCLLIAAEGKDWLFTDSRYHEAATRLWPEEHVYIYRANPPQQIGEHINHLFPNKKIGFDSRHISVDFHTRANLANSTVSNGLVEKLRVVKEDWEIEAIAASCAINERMMQWLPSQLTPGKTEAQVAWEIEQFFRNNGAEGLAFSSIVAVNGNAALPHAVPGATQITDGCAVLVDVGCCYNGYNSDQTRTFWVGDTSSPLYSLFTENLQYVKDAQKEAIKNISPGKTGEEVYTVACQVLEKAGVRELFTHGLGHGVGLQTHEAPRLSPSAKEPLIAGMVVTVEPGVYYPGKLGIRWEHMVVVTATGYRIV